MYVYVKYEIAKQTKPCNAMSIHCSIIMPQAGDPSVAFALMQDMQDQKAR